MVDAPGIALGIFAALKSAHLLREFDGAVADDIPLADGTDDDSPSVGDDMLSQGAEDAAAGAVAAYLRIAGVSFERLLGGEGGEFIVPHLVATAFAEFAADTALGIRPRHSKTVYIDAEVDCSVWAGIGTEHAAEAIFISGENGKRWHVLVV